MADQMADDTPIADDPPPAGTAAPAPDAPPPRALQNAAGLLLVGGCLSAFASAQILVGGPFFYTILPDWSATDSLDNEGNPVPGTVIPREVVLAWAAVGILLLLGAILAFMAYRKAKAGQARGAFGRALAASLLVPVNPLTVAGTVLAWRAGRSGATPRPATATPVGRSGLLTGGAWVLLAGTAVSAMAIVASVVEAVAFAVGSQTADMPASAAAEMLSTTALLGAAGAASTALGTFAFLKARRGHASAAGGWGLAAGFLPFNPVLLLGAALCLGSPERQSESAAAAQPSAPTQP